MPRKNHDSPPVFRSRPEVLALQPEVSGNAINGLGESAARRPTPIMWHPPEMLAHGALQQWFRARGTAAGAREERERYMAYMAQPLPEVAAEKPGWTAAEWSARIKRAALEREADLVGITRVRPEWIFEGYELPYAWVIVLGVAMDPDCLATAPSERSQTEVQSQYGRGARAAHKLAAWLREHGCEARPHGGSQAGAMLLIPAAIAAGLGELGKHGSMINRRFGSSFRLACVFTDQPLAADAPDVFGADDFCTRCQVCSRECPVDAIPPQKRLVRGDEKWYVDFDACFLYFIENNGCGICIGQCPWSRRGVASGLAEKLSRRRDRHALRAEE